MDTIDGKILMQLQENAKQNTKEIAAKVGLSVTPTYERIRKLEQQKIIKAYVALLDRMKIEKKLIAYCQVTLSKQQKKLADSFKEQILLLPDIMECHQVSGNFDYLLKIALDDIAEFHEFMNEKLSIIDGISTIHSSFVLNSVKDSTAYNL
ncbi:Lrp/AsnC family leucine-responsive transcriptional regulator/Lrp/AsnC family transcriptional regulator [Maribacter spongiicola]|uniref:Lrp/AsnC family leucine-responsive transcriptional regulator/Lrp/AsnC family transcriptional regulator n=1 Tax=Maribacter spongiicola TaxID=1206753 RepID=A0A4R7K7A8_9FLAO|nr:Lrp/AsnC family transcriptional regulator [Maribacter spongiicola]TDT47177.1 Lrp/AsnC family leucine-responsive transcriptional regulator/Lrp/AsnC family transcriptional regulator [Maribacter spongiicola]